jgi:Zn-dependent protease with chaperone function
MPTLLALVFLALFVSYLAVVWGFAFDAHRRLYGSDISRSAYVWSQISFSVPVLLPWLVLSAITDLINALPFEWLKNQLATTTGSVVSFMFFLVIVAVIGPAMIQKFWRCRPLEDSTMRQRIEALCKKANLEYANILYWPIFGGRMITAGVMGLIKKFRYILVTSALLSSLQPAEIDAVIAHEIGHVKRYHLVFYLVFFAGFMVLTYATYDLIFYAVIYTEPMFQFFSRFGFNPVTLTSVFLSVNMVVIFLIYFRFIFGYFMRNFERQADGYVYTLFDRRSRSSAHSRKSLTPAVNHRIAPTGTISASARGSVIWPSVKSIASPSIVKILRSETAFWSSSQSWCWWPLSDTAST